MATWSSLNVRNGANIRKGLDGIILRAPMSEATEITALKDNSGLLALPAGYKAVGYITKDQGAEWSRDINTSDVESLGAAEPTRRDVLTDVRGLQFTAQESNAIVMGLYDGVDLSAKTQAANGNVTWDAPDRPANTY